jgi:diguanylate cyclase (GGDEF)-like protein/PAS domain S-box-containing protein
MQGHTAIAMHYEPGLVVLSVAVAILAAYTALDLVRRAGEGRPVQGRLWLLGGAMALGTGIWTMHFVAMLAMKISIVVHYDGPITALSLVIAIVACGAGFGIIGRYRDTAFLFLGGTVIGLGIAAMHYTGMAALRLPAETRYDAPLVTLSVLIAVAAATIALWMPLLLKRVTSGHSLLADTAAALAMGFAIAGMHYTGMAATAFVTTDESKAIVGGFNFHKPVMAVAIAAAGGLLMILVLISSYFHRGWSRKLEHEKELYRASEERLQMIIGEVDDGIICIDGEGSIRLFNPAAERLFGYSRAEILGKKIELLMPEPHRSAHDGYIAEYRRTGRGKILGVGPREVEGLSKQGAPVPLELSINKVQFEGELQFIGVLRDMTQRKKAHAQLFYQANYDSLTGLLNRPFFLNWLGHAVAQAKRGGSQVGLLFLDLDGFKEINDTFGHDAGDRLLGLVADRLKHHTRESDSVARLGGDEFVVLLDRLEQASGAAVVAAKLLAALSSPCDLDGREASVSVSIGIAIYPTDADSPEAFLQRADSAMYAAKNAGKNQFRFAADVASNSTKMRKFP